MPNERRVHRPIEGKRDVRSLEDEVGALAERQHGVVARRQLVALGHSREQIDRRIARGYLLPLHRGVFAVGHRVSSRDSRWMAAVLACGDGAVLGRRSAGELYGIVPRRDLWPEVVRASACERRGIVVVRGVVREDERRLVDGIPVVSPPRAMLELAAVLDRRRLERAFGEIEVRRLRDRLSIPDLIARHPGRRGIAELRRVVGTEPDGITKRELEEAFVAFLTAHSIPRGKLNASIWVRDQFFEPDCLWRDQRLMVELDSRRFHDTDRRFQSDRKRDRVLLAECWRTIRITWWQLRDEPDALAADLRSALALAA